MSMDMPPDLRDALPGIGGSLTALLFFRKSWPMLIALFVCGAMSAYFLGPSVAGLMGGSRELGGFVTGAFSMAIVEGVIKSIQKFDGAEALRSVIQAFIKKMGG